MTTPSRTSDRRVQTACLLTLTLIACGVTVWLLQPVLVPFVLAVFFAECLAPLIDWQVRRLRMPRWAAVTVASIAGLGVLTGAGFLVGASLGKLSDNISAYRISLNDSWHSLVESRPAHWMGIHEATAGGAAGATTPSSFPQAQAIAFASTVFGETTNVLSHTAVVIVLLAFLLFGRKQPSKDRSGVIAAIEQRVQEYILLTIGMSTLTGVLIGSVLSILGVQYATFFGLLAFLLNFIPNLGGIITTLLPLPIIWLDPHMAVTAKFLALAIPGALQALLGSVVQPKIMGNSLDLHPVVLLLALLFFSMIWGIPGAFLATPLTAVIKIIFERIPATTALASLLAGDLAPITRTIDLPPDFVPPVELWTPTQPLPPSEVTPDATAAAALTLASTGRGAPLHSAS